MSSFPSIRIEGGLLGPELLDQVIAADVPGQKPADFGLEPKRNLTDEIAAVFADSRALWGVFKSRLTRLPENDLATTVTRDQWALPFLALLGYPAEFSQTSVQGLTTRFAMKHMAFYYSISADGLPIRDGWDYVEANCWHHEKSDLPESFAGVSGGPVWGLEIKRDKKTGKFSMLDFALIGIAFFQTGIKNDERRIRAHFIKSIYRTCWRNLK
jgi:hypothetical protein